MISVHPSVQPAMEKAWSASLGFSQINCQQDGNLAPFSFALLYLFCWPDLMSRSQGVRNVYTESYIFLFWLSIECKLCMLHCLLHAWTRSCMNWNAFREFWHDYLKGARFQCVTKTLTLTLLFCWDYFNGNALKNCARWSSALMTLTHFECHKRVK